MPDAVTSRKSEQWEGGESVGERVRSYSGVAEDVV